jgi:hypothetical protein
LKSIGWLRRPGSAKVCHSALPGLANAGFLKMDDPHVANASELASIPRTGRKSLTILYALLKGATLRYHLLRFDNLRRRSDRASSGEAKVAQS